MVKVSFKKEEILTNKEFGESLEKRTRQFAVKVVRLSLTLPNTPESRVIRNQLTKSASSVGANYYEANRSRSRNDFINKIKICESEANETIFWLDMLTDLKWADNSVLVSELKNEVKQLLAIFTSTGRKLREKNEKN